MNSDQPRGENPDADRSVEEIYADVRRTGAVDPELDGALTEMQALFAAAETHEERRAISDRMYTDADGKVRTRQLRSVDPDA